METSKTAYLEVGGKAFLLDSEDVHKLDSSFLTTLVDPESNFAQPQDGIFTVEADAACFDAFLFLGRYGVLPQLPVEDEVIMAQADFWGLHEKVAAELKNMIDQRNSELKRQLGHKLEEQRNNDRNKWLEYIALTSDLEKAKHHHNHRHDDGRGRIHCNDCNNRDIDDRFSEGDDYIDCKGCGTTIFYSRDLGWCHKCSRCRQCQRGGACPNDLRKTSSWNQKKPTPTKQLEGAVSDLKKELRV